MEIWLDTTDLRVVADAVKTGLLSGVTTNPSILSKEAHIKDSLSRLLEIQSGPVAVQVTSNDPVEMLDQGRAMVEFSNRIIVKIPVTYNGLIAMEQLRKEAIPTMGTTVLSAKQALLASALDTSYIAPYFSHMGEFSQAAEKLKSMVNILRSNGSKTKVLVASLKEMEHLIFCAQTGLDAVTIKPELFQQLIADDLIVEGFLEKFASEWKSAHGATCIKRALA